MGACGLMPLIIYYINVIFKNKTKQKAFSIVAKEIFPRPITNVRDGRIIQQLFNYSWQQNALYLNLCQENIITLAYFTNKNRGGRGRKGNKYIYIFKSLCVHSELQFLQSYLKLLVSKYFPNNIIFVVIFIGGKIGRKIRCRAIIKLKFRK